ncbi:MAG TPA: YraN family protein [Longimicrobiales bacterium]|nr:YraN family protein [Longimicrobiales bacterium]
MSSSHRLGRSAERLAVQLLQGRGWRILERNWRFGHKELDLVAERDDVVAFVEVKARTGTAFGHPIQAIDGRKRRDLAVAARAWIARYGRRDAVYRFDSVTVLRTGSGTRVEHTPDAWRI